jgi:large subunit ribosomal protein L15
MAYNLSTIRAPKKANEKKKRVGRGMGSGMGKTSTRGHKGQGSRSGSRQKRGFEGGQMPLHRRLPKRGFTNALFKKTFSTVNVNQLAKFENGSKVGPPELVAAGVIRKVAKSGLRVLGDGQIDRALHVSAHYFTEGAREKITKAGGTCEVISL